jgi:HAD superfamily hydrolase (TIGR01662 family)
MSRLDTVIFDVSGVLLDDLYAVWMADREAYERCGVGNIRTVEEFREKFKLPILEYHKSMGVPDEVIPRLEEEYRRAYMKYNHAVRIFPEVKAVLRSLWDNGIKLAVASNIPSEFLKEHLQRFGIERFFRATTGQDDCPEQKPSPKPILVTLRRMNSDPRFSAYVGDMEEDIIAGKKAGVTTVAVCRERGYHPCWRLRRRSPDFVIRNLWELIPIVK